MVLEIRLQHIFFGDTIQSLTISDNCLPQTCSVEFTDFIECCRHILGLPNQIVAVLGVLPFILNLTGAQTPAPGVQTLALLHALCPPSRPPPVLGALWPTLSPFSAVLAARCAPTDAPRLLPYGQLLGVVMTREREGSPGPALLGQTLNSAPWTPRPLAHPTSMPCFPLLPLQSPARP